MHTERNIETPFEEIGTYPRRPREAKGIIVNFRLPESMEREVDLLMEEVRSAGLPIKTRSDLFREAIVWYCQVLAERLGADNPQLKGLQMQSRLSDRAAYLAGLKDEAYASVRALTSGLLGLILTNQIAEARTELNNFLSGVYFLAEPARTHYLSAMEHAKDFQDAQSAIQELERDNGQEAVTRGQAHRRSTAATSRISAADAAGRVAVPLYTGYRRDREPAT